MSLEHDAFELGWGDEEAVCDAALFGREAGHFLPGAVAVQVRAGLDEEDELDHGFGAVAVANEVRRRSR